MRYEAGQASASNNPAGAPRENTELEALIGTLRDRLFNAHSGVRAIYTRVMPPTPSTASSATVSPIATTYGQRIQELITAAEDLRDLVTELNGRI